MLMAEKIADAGGNIYTATTSKKYGRKTKRLAGSYKTNTGVEGIADRVVQVVQAIDDGLKPAY
jgi:hypothetical protein